MGVSDHLVFCFQHLPLSLEYVTKYVCAVNPVCQTHSSMPSPQHLLMPVFSYCQPMSLSLSVCLACSCLQGLHPATAVQSALLLVAPNGLCSSCPQPNSVTQRHSCMHAVPLVQLHTHSCVCWSGVRRASSSDQAEQRQDCLEGSAECPDRSDGNMATSQACCC